MTEVFASGGESPDEIEVTAAMLSAGMLETVGWPVGELPCSEMLKDVYLAMESARRCSQQAATSVYDPGPDCICVVANGAR